MLKLKRVLRLSLITAVFGLFAGLLILPAEALEESLASELSASTVVVELYSSQACVFCPAADRFLADLVETTDIIGLACHVDYFDVKAGSLARHFCSERQSDYMTYLRAGPNYTPQMVVNGVIDVIGYKHEDVLAALTEAAKMGTGRIIIQKTEAAEGQFLASLPALSETEEQEIVLWKALFDKPHNLEVAEGHNRGMKMTYVNIVNDLQGLGLWDGKKEDRIVSANLTEGRGGFVILAQNAKSGKIVAAGSFSAD